MYIIGSHIPLGKESCLLNAIPCGHDILFQIKVFSFFAYVYYIYLDFSLH